ncbi:MAG: type I methionyl aminopeptidase [Ignavibacteria bacterium]|nr:type I methionyl aminopeptidase [Ignavibacteria bacterium]MBT8383843.1 type I methionyl aminopeptidase [Ignavibacteria bacterium]MBT8392075.1 type I methionyl aminopeptidase [Ignavibacteria bacterium]NNJ54038.1 type I methionyl aminopeptidase [Ignavibacteriaceae bacterium]NNL21002.1 type I methionyl aminopeptidase [Ignavibacteriaceae bacterium]
MIYIKTKNEIDCIKESCRIVAETLQLIKSNVQPGITTLELDRIAEDYIRSNDAIPAFKGYSQSGLPGFPGSICASVDDVVVHGIPGNRKLEVGEILSVDVGVLKNKFFGDAALTVAVGEISKEKQNLLEVTEESLHLAIQQAKSGNRVHDISFAVQDYIEKNGFSVVKDLCGHGVGKFLHEEPSIPNFGKKGTGAKLKNGMTLAIEPMVNSGGYRVKTGEDGWTVSTQDGSSSAHFEHTILLNNNHPEILTVC